MSDCAKARTGKTTMPFNCKKPRGHEGRCSPYTLAPTGTWLDYLRMCDRLARKGATS